MQPYYKFEINICYDCLQFSIAVQVSATFLRFKSRSLILNIHMSKDGVEQKIKQLEVTAHFFIVTQP